jgi:hypothetical protein
MMRVWYSLDILSDAKEGAGLRCLSVEEILLTAVLVMHSLSRGKRRKLRELSAVWNVQL